MAGRLAPLACVLASLVAAAVVVPLVASAKGTQSSSAQAVDLGVLQQLNQIRVAHNLAPLGLNTSLNAAALQHSREMLSNGYFAHDSADGQPFWKRIATFYPWRRDGYWSVGENLYWTSGHATASSSMRAWMASPLHRANILNPAWRQIGIATVSSPDAPGTYADGDSDRDHDRLRRKTLAALIRLGCRLSRRPSSRVQPRNAVTKNQAGHHAPS